MSRIPKIPIPSEMKPSLVQPAVRPRVTTAAGVKRAAEEKVPLKEKKPRTCLNEVANRKVLGTIQPVHGKNNFSEKAKKAVLQQLPSETNLVRESMPAIRLGCLKPNVPGKTKRPAWDLKGRIQDMEENFQRTQMRNASLLENLEATNLRMAALESANSMLHRDVEVKSEQSEEASAQIRKLETLLKQKTEECETLSKEKDAEASKAHALNHKMAWLQNDYNQLQQMYQEETSSLKSSITSLSSSRSVTQSQLEATQLLLQNEREEKEKLFSQNQSLLQRIADLEDKLREGESVRRKLHNTVQELKGNIRVYCRLRPPLQQELKRGMVVANIQVAKEKSIEIYLLSENSKEPKYEFSFDSVFSPSASQEEVFTEISQLVQSSLDGYNVCIFAYGQTGSGKTFTMEGPESIKFSSESLEPNLGMIPRSVCQIFQSISELAPRGWKYHIEALFLEIYNERIQNLLDHRNSSGKCEIVKSGGNGTDCKLSNVTASEVTSSEQVFELLKKARISRAVAATKCNEYSSRSHFVFQLKIYGENLITNKKCEGTLNLVDLAGSERVKESGSAGERLTEAKAINKSLSNLGNVIMSLSKKESHVPYRDSKLTHLLANSLGGNSKTLMFVNIGPDNENLNETINSLRFATKVNQCNIGTAQKRVKQS